ncbi:hypothetical protein [Paenibacillus urinalis]|uniref:hypothetical protein n=1 Tax=Paenibacillus urinalis TaxID=521520 RepID=UPI0019603A4A
MKTYNPTLWNIHEVEVSLMDEDGYTGSLIVELGGNITGLSILDGVIQSLEDCDFEPIENEVNEKHITSITDDGYPEEISLFKGDDELIVDAGDISSYVVGVRIISFRPSKVFN